VFFYESRETGNKSEAMQAAETALKLINAVKENVAARNIQLDLDMK
jgi:hypothetical protein